MTGTQAVQGTITGLSDKELELVKVVFDMGGSITIAIIIVLALSLITWRLGGQFLKILQHLAENPSRQADAMAGQAKAMGEMKDALSQYILTDNSEHREILLGVEVMADKLNNLTKAVKEQRDDKDGSD